MWQDNALPRPFRLLYSRYDHSYCSKLSIIVILAAFYIIHISFSDHKKSDVIIESIRDDSLVSEAADQDPYESDPDLDVYDYNAEDTRNTTKEKIEDFSFVKYYSSIEPDQTIFEREFGNKRTHESDSPLLEQKLASISPLDELTDCIKFKSEKMEDLEIPRFYNRIQRKDLNHMLMSIERSIPHVHSCVDLFNKWIDLAIEAQNKQFIKISILSNNGSPREKRWAAISATYAKKEDAKNFASLLSKLNDLGFKPQSQDVRSILGVAYGIHGWVDSNRYATFSSERPGIDASRCWFGKGNAGTDHVGHWQCLPSFIIIGVMKGGTFELKLWLMKHPRLKTNDISREVHYFDSLSDSSNSWLGFKRGKHDEIGNVNSSWVSYLEEFPSLSTAQMLADIPLMFEKTPAYFDSSDPSAIAKLLPSVKLVLILREPGERLYSSYWHRCNLFHIANCSVDDFERSVLSVAEANKKNLYEFDVTSSRPSDESDQSFLSVPFNDTMHLRYTLMGFYARLIKKYIDGFNSVKGAKAKLLITFSSTFKAKPFLVFEEIFDFIGIERYNYKPIARKTTGGYWVISIKSKNLSKHHRNYVPLSSIPEISERLKAFYSPINKELRDVFDNKHTLSESNLEILFSSVIPDWVH